MAARGFKQALGCWVLSAVLGCAAAPLKLASREQTPPALPSSLASYYDYPSREPRAAAVLLQKNAAYDEYLVRFPLSVPAGFEPTEPVVEIEWFEARLPGKQPALVFNAILGGDYPIERALCRSLAKRGFHVALIHRKTLKVSPENNISQLEVLLRQGVFRIRQTVDWMAAQENVDPARMGSFGISMGGIASVLSAAIEPRLRAHVVALAGGGVADILMNSHDKLLTKPLALYLSRNHLDKTTVEQQLRETVKTDPVLLAPYADPKKILLFVALLDRTIGRAQALRLRKALGRPQTVFLPMGHYTSYLALPYLQYTSIRFLKQRLGREQPPRL